MKATYRDVLTNMHNPQAQGNLCVEHGYVTKPTVTQNYNKHMGCVHKVTEWATTHLEVDKNICFSLATLHSF
jgi:hypothetical protein